MPPTSKTPKPFSQELAEWLHSQQPKTIGGLEEIAAQKSFAIIFLVLMALPALPLPTGGATHVFEVVVILLALQMVAGRRSVWIPNFFRKHSLGKGMLNKVIPTLIKIIRWFEKFSRPHMSSFLNNREFLRLVAVAVIALSTAAMVAPPFSGLDTIPAVGVVLIALGLILEDILLLVAGTIIGSAGVVLMITLGEALIRFIQQHI